MTLESPHFEKIPAELERKLTGKVWKSADVSVVNGATIQAGGTGNIAAIIPNLEPLTRQVLPYASFSTRSRYAQVGIDVPHSAGKLMAENLQEINGDLMTLVPVRNNSARSVSLPSGTRLFRLFIEPSEASIEREALLRMIEEEEITVSGERGRDWEVLFGTRMGLLWLKLNPNKTLWVPPDPDGVAIEISDRPGIDYRSLVDIFLRQAPVSETSIHWVGETVSTLRLSPFASAIIDRVPLGRDAVLAHGSEHINSLLLDGGSPEWPIRTEILSPTSPGKIPEYILLRFLRDK